MSEDDRRDDNVVRLFPSLPRVPDAPDSTDERQKNTRRILQNIQGHLMGHGGSTTANLETGYPASAPDLGRLQDLLEQPMGHLDMEEVRERWDRDLRDWMEKTLLHWVQRVKMIELEPRENGIHVRIDTQDDRGYYGYRFDVVPGRPRP